MDVHKKKDISSKQKDINEHKFAAHVENLMEKTMEMNIYWTYQCKIYNGKDLFISMNKCTHVKPHEYRMFIHVP